MYIYTRIYLFSLHHLSAQGTLDLTLLLELLCDFAHLCIWNDSCKWNDSYATRLRSDMIQIRHDALVIPLVIPLEPVHVIWLIRKCTWLKHVPWLIYVNIHNSYMWQHSYKYMYMYTYDSHEYMYMTRVCNVSSCVTFAHIFEHSSHFLWRLLRDTFLQFFAECTLIGLFCERDL